jgi:hypothetical protein
MRDQEVIGAIALQKPLVSDLLGKQSLYYTVWMD